MASPPSELTATVERGAGGDFLLLPSASICLQAGSGPVEKRVLGLSTLTLGSQPECDWPLVDPQVSRAHCSLQLTPNGLVLRDLGSKNGTYLGTVRITEVRLPPDVPVRLGSHRLWVESNRNPKRIPLSDRSSFGDALGTSLPMRAMFSQLERACATEDPILLMGESGTGKESLARGVHALSPRRKGPFVVVDCAALSPSLVEAELFGVERGAFTSAETARPGLVPMAHGGTLFLDELGELPLAVQPRFLRALEAGEVYPVGSSAPRPADVRVVAATHRDIRAKLAEGSFREDLYYRLAVLEVQVPPLRERLEDLELLAEHFLAQQSPARTLEELPPGTLELFRSYRWPGNVRELSNALTRLFITPGLGSLEPSAGGRAGAWSTLPLREARNAVLAAFERQYVEQMLEVHAGSVTSAARAMGVSRQLLHRLLARYHLRGDRAET